MSTILLVTPRQGPADILALLRHEAVIASGSADALRQVDLADVVIVDGRDDLAWARAVTGTLSGTHPAVPILLLVPVTGLALVNRDWGMADFMTDGAEPAELDARIRLLARAGDSHSLAVGALRLDEGAYQVTLAGEPLNLTYTEFELLRYLMQHPGRVLSREVLLNQVWGYDYFGGTRTVDVHIRRLRAKLGQFDHFIGTVRNVGYRFTSGREASDDQR